ncbi:MAG: bifunctional diguanylate cyclase/phosphodiesterase [Pseudomonadota bacterium]
MTERLQKIEQGLLRARDRFRAALACLAAALTAFAVLSGDMAVAAAALAGLAAVAGLGLLVARPLGALIEAVARFAEEAETRRNHEVRHDDLTGLPNRAYLMEFLDYTLNNASRRDGRVGVCMIDLKGLRRLNEARGCLVGDQALRRCATLVRTETRRGDFVARIGADEFMIVSSDAAEVTELAVIAARICRALRRPFDVDGAQVEFGCAAGVALTERGDVCPDRLVNDAAIALRAAKDREKECVVFEAALREDFDASLRLRDELKAALGRGEIRPWFQPQVDARDGRVLGLEALARWEHPGRGPLGPGAFFDIAEEFGLLDRVDEAVLDASLDALIAWRADGLDVPQVGVNLSARRLNDPYLAERVKWALEARDLEPSDLCIEVLESVLIDRPDCEVARNLDSLSRIGVSVDLDDFGTGHAAIATLKRIKVDRIKIDRSFVTNVDVDPDQRKVAQTLIDLARSLGIKALAEGVETAGEQAQLAAMGCDALQGFGLARPMPAGEIGPWLRSYLAEREEATG